MSLIDRYIHEVGRHLPRKNRSDIQAELRSLLTDSLEDRAGTKTSEADVAALLKEFGSLSGRICVGSRGRSAGVGPGD